MKLIIASDNIAHTIFTQSNRIRNKHISERQQMDHTSGTLPSSSKRCTDQSHHHQYTSVGVIENLTTGKEK